MDLSCGITQVNILQVSLPSGVNVSEYYEDYPAEPIVLCCLSFVTIFQWGYNFIREF